MKRRSACDIPGLSHVGYGVGSMAEFGRIRAGRRPMSKLKATVPVQTWLSWNWGCNHIPVDQFNRQWYSLDRLIPRSGRGFSCVGEQTAKGLKIGACRTVLKDVGIEDDSHIAHNMTYSWQEDDASRMASRIGIHFTGFGRQCPSVGRRMARTSRHQFQGCSRVTDLESDHRRGKNCDP